MKQKTKEYKRYNLHNKYQYVIHRKIIEENIGRKLTKEEIVHHINGNTRDNRIKNLLLLPNKNEHNKLHAGNFCPQGHDMRKPENLSIRTTKDSRRCKECGRIYSKAYTLKLKKLKKTK